MAEPMRASLAPPRPGGVPWYKTIPQPVMIVGGTVVIVGGLLFYKRWREAKAANANISPLDSQYAYQSAPSGSGTGGGGGGGGGSTGESEGFRSMFEALNDIITNIVSQGAKEPEPATPPAASGGVPVALAEASSLVDDIWRSTGVQGFESSLSPDRRARIAQEIAYGGRDPSAVQRSVSTQSDLYQTYRDAFAAQGVTGAGYGPGGVWETADQRINRLVSQTINNQRSQEAILGSIRIQGTGAKN